MDTAGVAYLTGSFYSSAEIGNTSLSSSGHDDIFVAKIDASGNWLWAVRGGGSEAGDYGENIGLDSASNAYVIGPIEGTTPFNAAEDTGVRRGSYAYVLDVIVSRGTHSSHHP